jgi:CheY-like chemotaxis protein
MDVQMPEMDGLTATRLLRADPLTANLPIIAVTALALPDDRIRCLEAGASSYLSKPVSLRELVGEIAELLASRPKPAVIVASATPSSIP